MSNNNTSFAKRLWNTIRRRSSFVDENNPNPYIIVTNFRETNEKECGKVDTINEKKYKHLLNKANKAEKTIKSTGLSMNVEVPPPPHPSNRDRYILWRKRNSVKHVIPQTKAVSFLTREGYTLDKDYEAYQAIDLANEIRKKKGLPLETEDETIYFKNVFTNKDKNIYRKRSMVKSGTRQRNESLSTSPSNSSLDSIEKLENSKYLRGGTKIFDVKSRTSTLPALPVHTEEPIMNVVASAPPAVVQVPVQQVQQVQQSRQTNPEFKISNKEGQTTIQVGVQASAPQPLPMPEKQFELKATGFGCGSYTI